MRVPAKQRNVYVEFQRPTNTQDAGGGSTQAYTTYATAWVEKKDASGREFTLAQQTHPTMAHMLIADWNPDIALSTTKDRIRLMGTDRYLNILAKDDPNESHNEVVFVCAESVDG